MELHFQLGRRMLESNFALENEMISIEQIFPLCCLFFKTDMASIGYAYNEQVQLNTSFHRILNSGWL